MFASHHLALTRTHLFRTPLPHCTMLFSANLTMLLLALSQVLSESPTFGCMYRCSSEGLITQLCSLCILAALYLCVVLADWFSSQLEDSRLSKAEGWLRKRACWNRKMYFVPTVTSTVSALIPSHTAVCRTDLLCV